MRFSIPEIETCKLTPRTGCRYTRVLFETSCIMLTGICAFARPLKLSTSDVRCVGLRGTIFDSVTHANCPYSVASVHSWKTNIVHHTHHDEKQTQPPKMQKCEYPRDVAWHDFQLHKTNENSNQISISRLI